MLIRNVLGMALGMLALQKHQPCSALDFKYVGNKMTMHDGIFREKYWMKQLRKSWLFCISSTSLQQQKWGKLQAKAGKNRAVNAPSKPLVATGELQCDLCQHQKMTSQTKKPYFNPWYDLWDNLFKKLFFCLWKIIFSWAITF